MSIRMSKYQGLGNDYLVLDPNVNGETLDRRKIERICRRNFGVGADGILYGPLAEDKKWGVKIYNPDGSEAEKSGNGALIFAKYLLDKGYVKEGPLTLRTLSGDSTAEFLNSSGTKVRVDMGKAVFASAQVPVVGESREIVNEPVEFHDGLYNMTCLSVGNPHCVIMMEDVTGNRALELGPYVENSRLFPNRINMQLLKVLDKRTLQIEVYERGAGYTLSSGTSACAAAAAAYRMGLVEPSLTVRMVGGDVEIQVGTDYEIRMTGSVGYIGEVTLEEEFFA